MSRKILRRCDICGRFHAAYLVPVEDGQRFYCYDCWKARFNPSTPQTSDKDDAPSDSMDLEKDPS